LLGIVQKTLVTKVASNQFYIDLKRKAFVKISLFIHSILVVAGDFNSKIGQKSK